jgi:hypothetical protein
MLEPKPEMCNLYSITTNQAAIIALFRVVIRAAIAWSWSGLRCIQRSPGHHVDGASLAEILVSRSATTG